jgi:ADP-heptose:LPS heptosyltransferase
MRLKRLELWWRALCIHLLVRLMRRSPDARPQWKQAQGTQPFRVLFLRHDRAGDMIVSTGVMRAIARSQPAISLDVLASPLNASIVDGADYIEHVIVFDKKNLASYLPTLLRLRRAHYDAVVDCMVTAPSVTTLLLIFASGARYRVGIAGRGNDAAFNLAVPADTRAAAHMVDLLAPLAAAFDVDTASADRQPSLQITDAERERAELVWSANASDARRALINVSAGTSERVWPDENYVAVMRHLSALDPSVVLRVIGAPAEAARAERIARDGGGVAVRTPSIRDALALVATANFVFTPDTSITHAASAFRTPAVAIFLSNKAERWGLYGNAGENVQHPGPTLATLGVDRVLSAIDRVWNEAVRSAVAVDETRND